MVLNSSHRNDLLDEVKLLGKPGGGQLRILFNGPFEGGEVCWDATLYTPRAWAEEFDEAPPTQNIIEIGGESEHGVTLAVCLKVTSMDRPTVRKAVMMIRQYKRLSRGRHQYG